MCRTRFALIVIYIDYEGEIHPEATLPTYKDIKACVKKKYGLIADFEGAKGHYVQIVNLSDVTKTTAFVRIPQKMHTPDR